MTSTEKSQPTRRIWITLSALVILVVLLVVTSVAVNNQPTPTATPTVQMQALPTANPTIIASISQLPNATPISAEEDARLVALRDEVIACDQYSEVRQGQMLQHITWLRDQTTIPQDIAFALTLNASSVTGGLVYGMGIYTSTEWRLLERPAESCLADIGQTINDMLIVVGEPPITIYDEADQ